MYAFFSIIFFVCFVGMIVSSGHPRYFSLAFQIRKKQLCMASVFLQTNKKTLYSKLKTHKSNAYVNKEFYDFFPVNIFINKLLIIFIGESYIFLYTNTHNIDVKIYVIHCIYICRRRLIAKCRALPIQQNTQSMQDKIRVFLFFCCFCFFVCAFL